MKIKASLKRIVAGISLLSLMVYFSSCENSEKEIQHSGVAQDTVYLDKPFIQETHEAFYVSGNERDNEVRSIAVDENSNVWIATAGGVFRKNANDRKWISVITGEERGPAFSVAIGSDGAVLMGTWNGLYIYQNNTVSKAKGIESPISVVCTSEIEKYALGPRGIWKYSLDGWQKQDFKIARSIHDAIVDREGNLYVATDAGLYFCGHEETKLYQDTKELITCYVKSVAFAPEDKLWAGVMGGVSIRLNNELQKNLTPETGIPSIYVNCVRQSPDETMWVGTDVGVVRYAKNGSHSLLFSRRWLLNNKVNDVAFDKNGNAWVATAGGVSEIKRGKMTLAEKQDNFYHQLMSRHIREPWICCNVRLDAPGDTASWHKADDDNDGEFTGGYLAMESFRYAATKDPDALEKARKAFHFLRYLREVTETKTIFARTIVPANWKEVHDPNRSYTEKQQAEAMVDDPRYKPVEKRWRKSKDGKWLWKGDTSSDEMCGHMMSYFFFYEYAAQAEDKKEVRAHVSDIMDGLIANDYNLVDIEGKHTRWGVWSPKSLNGDPDWSSEKAINSFELLAFLKLAAHITGNEKYESEYKRLIEKEGYLENASMLNKKNPAWQIYFDLTMEGYLFPIFLKYEEEPELHSFYERLAKEWMDKQPEGENLINNLTYALATGDKVNVPQTIEFLKDAPLDLVDWPIDHTLREDVTVVRSPILEEIQIAELPPASIRATVRWDKNPWAAVQGNPTQERECVFWLWPYWMARYLDIIKT